MPNKRTVLFKEFYGDDVEAAGRLDQFDMFGQIAEGDFPDLSALGRSDRFLGKSALGIGPGFNLEEDQGRTVPGDDVDFSAPETVAADDEAIFFLEEIANGGFFAATA